MVIDLLIILTAGLIADLLCKRFGVSLLVCQLSYRQSAKRSIQDQNVNLR